MEDPDKLISLADAWQIFLPDFPGSQIEHEILNADGNVCGYEIVRVPPHHWFFTVVEFKSEKWIYIDEHVAQAAYEAKRHIMIFFRKNAYAFDIRLFLTKGKRRYNLENRELLGISITDGINAKNLPIPRQGATYNDTRYPDKDRSADGRGIEVDRGSRSENYQGNERGSALQAGMPRNG